MPHTTTPDSNTLLARSAHHQPFSWLATVRPDTRGGDFTATTFDICKGISLCIEIVHSSELTRAHNKDADLGDEDTPTLDVTDTDRLLRFAKVAAELLANYAEQRIEWLNSTGRGDVAQPLSEGGAA